MLVTPGSVQSAHTCAGHPDLHHGQLRGPCPVATHREEAPGHPHEELACSSQLPPFFFLFFSIQSSLTWGPQLGSASSAPTGFTGDHTPAQGMRRTVAWRLLRDLRPLLLGMLTSLGLAAAPGCLDGMSRPGICLLTVTVPWLPIPGAGPTAGRRTCAVSTAARRLFSCPTLSHPSSPSTQRPSVPVQSPDRATGQDICPGWR